MSKKNNGVSMMKWHEFAKQYQSNHKLDSYTDALKQAPGAWTKYKSDFAAKNPDYDHKAVLAAERKERERKIKAGLIPPPKQKSAAAKKAGGVSSNTSSPSLDSTKKKVGGEGDSDDDYDVVIRTTTTKKRKRSSSGSGSSSSSSNPSNDLSPHSSSAPKNKRKRTPPVKKTPTSYDDGEVPPLTKKSLGKPIPLPASSIKRKSKGAKGKEKEDTYPTMAQEMEEEFLEEMEEGEVEEEGNGVVRKGGGGGVSVYAEDAFY
jgi:hypothetical protein